MKSVYDGMYSLVANWTQKEVPLADAIRKINVELLGAKDVAYNHADKRYYTIPDTFNDVPTLALDLGGRCGWTLLGGSAMSGNIPLATWLLDQGASIHKGNQFGHTPLYIACNHGQLDMAKFLRSRGADLHMAVTMWSGDTMRGNTGVGSLPLTIAKKRGYQDIVAFLEAEIAKETEAKIAKETEAVEKKMPRLRE